MMAMLLQELSELAEERKLSELGEAAENGATGVAQEQMQHKLISMPQPDPSAAARLVLHSSWQGPEGLEFDNIQLPKNLEQIDADEVEHIIASFADGIRLPAQCLMRLLEVSSQVLSREPTVLDLTSRSRVTVVGDLHGSLPCLTEVLRLCGRPSPERAIVFNGDFVDRGKHSTEVLAGILLMKLAHPNDVYCLRGNHEDGFLATVYGFQKEIRMKYPLQHDILWECMKNTFGALPFCARTAEAFILHGGLPSQELSIADIASITSEERNLHSVIKKKAPESKRDLAEILQGLVWSDPVREESGITKNPKRGSAGINFGTDVARNWLKEHGLQYLVRSHQLIYEGWERIDCGEGTALYTVFSAANYPGENGRNKGAILELEYGQPPVPIIYAHPGRLLIEDSHFVADLDRTVMNLVYAHKNRLKEAFLRRSSNGKVSVDAWAEVMKVVLGLDIDWKALQPHLVQTVKRAHQINGGAAKLIDTGLIDSAKFLDRNNLIRWHHQNGISKGSEINDSTLEVLYGNHEQLRAVFEFLDTDGNGTVSREEFWEGMKLLNQRLPPEQQFKDVDKLFSAVDIDRSGEIDPDEFYAIFKVDDPAAHQHS